MQRNEKDIEKYSCTVLGRVYLASEIKNIEAIASITGESPNTIRRYLNTRVQTKVGYSIGVLAAICEALEVDIKDVIGDAVYDYF